MPKKPINYQELEAPTYPGMKEDMAEMEAKAAANRKKKKKKKAPRKKRGPMSYLSNKKSKENYLKGVTME